MFAFSRMPVVLALGVSLALMARTLKKFGPVWGTYDKNDAVVPHQPHVPYIDDSVQITAYVVM